LPSYLGRGAIGSEETNIDIHTDVVGLKCHVYVSSEMTFVLPVFGEGQVQEVGTAHQHFPASEREADPFFCRDCFPFRDSHSLISMWISTFHSVT
jgi:hypothetical protein